MQIINVQAERLTSGQSNAPSLTGTAIVLEASPASPSSIPADGIDVYLSNDLVTKLKDTTKTNCGSLDNPNCESSVAQVLRDNSVDLQERTLGVLASLGAGVILLIAAVIPRLEQDTSGNIPAHIHIPSAQLSQVSAAIPANTIAFATGTGKGYVTITGAPLPTTPTGYVKILI